MQEEVIGRSPLFMYILFIFKYLIVSDFPLPENRETVGNKEEFCMLKMMDYSIAGSARRQCVLNRGCLRQTIGRSRLVAMIRWLY